MNRSHRFIFAALLSLSALSIRAQLSDLRFSGVSVAPSKTSIYVGSVSLTPELLRKNGDHFEGRYHVSVFPAFFYSENGDVTIDLPAEAIEKLAHGEMTEFTGIATNDSHKERRITGKATPSAPGSLSGKIKVRIWVSKKIELIFNTSYQFTGG